MCARQPVVQVGDAPSRFKYQPRNFCHLGKVNFLNRVRWAMVIHRSSVKIENDGNAVFRVIPVV